MDIDEAAVAEALRGAGARFALVHGSRAQAPAPELPPGHEPGSAPAPPPAPRPESDLDVGAWWAHSPPHSWELALPGYVDLVVLNSAPLWLAGRIAQYGRVLFDDEPSTRVAWQADTRVQYLDEIPAVRARYQQRLDQLAQRTQVREAQQRAGQGRAGQDHG